MIVVDEYLTVRVLRGHWPGELPDDEDLGLPASAHWRLLQALHGNRDGQLSRLFAGANQTVIDAIRWPHPEVIEVLDPRPLLDRAAVLINGRQLYFGTHRNLRSGKEAEMVSR